ncbi:hypothetical protein L5515_012599 [Caenorhabditis briggsae]|uniref:Neurotransmitter-gated ion-channel ligand-binding domain-containing protein n=1 Tax=Caenorhabditis briggsae TaxID=6238 RepID=A0AAE9EWD8_CAEBR|nr:hypothetical protein L5515_012599 [Caenorhabditis briggsae]
MYHSVYGRVPDYAPDASAEIHYNGRVRMFVSIASKSFCPINFKRFPFDSQTCSFSCGSWAYQSNIVNLVAAKEEIALEDFYDNQEWLLTDARLFNGTTRNVSAANESFSMVYMKLDLKRQSFYYVFNLVFPTTLVSLVAVVGFHAPINATGRRESKFRLGIMTLLSMSVMLLMLVGEMKFAMESVPGQRGSFSDVPLMGIYYMTLICIVSIATCTSSIFVHLEKFALRNPSWQSVPWYIRWLAAKKLFCCYVPKSFRYDKDAYSRNNNVQAISLHSTPDRNVGKNLIPKEINFTEVNQDAPLHDVLEGTSAEKTQKIDLVVNLLREIINLKERIGAAGQLAPYWERIISRAEKVSLSFYLLLITINVLMFLYPELWY